jgi:hypothetical protein
MVCFGFLMKAFIDTGYFSVKMGSDTAWSRLMRCFTVAIAFNGVSLTFGILYVILNL